MAGSLTHFPYFGTNYPSNLQSLDEFVRVKFGELARMNERWAAIETSHKRVAPSGTGQFFEPEPRGRPNSSLLPREWSESGGTHVRSSSAGRRARPASASHVKSAADADALAERQRELLSSYPLTMVGHVTGRLPARPDTAATAPTPVLIDESRDVLELDGRDLRREADMLALLTVAPNLLILSLRRCTVSDAALRVLPRVCPHITHIDLSDAKGFGTEALILTVAGLPKLSGVRLSSCDHVFAPPREELEAVDAAAALRAIQQTLYPVGSDPRLERSVLASLAEVAALPPPPVLRGVPEEESSPAVTARSAAASPRKTEPSSSPTKRAPSSSVVDEGDVLEDVSALLPRPAPARRIDSVPMRPKSAKSNLMRIMEDAEVGVPLGSARDSSSAQIPSASVRPSSAVRRRPLSALVRSTASRDPAASSPPTGVTPSAAPGTVTRPAALLSPAPAAAAPAPSDGAAASSSEVFQVSAAAGKLLCHAMGAAPHQLSEVSFSRCEHLTDDMFYAISGQSAGLVGADIEQSSKELFHTDPVATAAASAGGKGAASWAARMTEAEIRQAEADAAKKAQLDEVRRRMGLQSNEEVAQSGAHPDSSEPAMMTTQLGVQLSDTPALRRGSTDGGKVMALYKPQVCDLPLSLQVLDLTGCTSLTDHALAFIGANCPNLAVLRLRYCDQPSITDAGIASVAAGCTKLLCLDVRGCAQLTGASVTALARHCPDLQRLALGGCTNMDDAAVGVLATSRASSSLLDLDLTRCKAVTGNAVKNLMFRAPGLARPPGDGILNLTLCSAVTAPEIEVLCKTFTTARIVCALAAETDPNKPALVPTFSAPPKDEAFASRKVFAVYSMGSAAGKKNAKGKKK